MTTGAAPQSWPLRWRPLLMSVVIWGVVAVAMAIAAVLDGAARGKPAAVTDTILMVLPFFLPLALLSWGLHAALVRWPVLGERPGRVAALYAGLLLVFLPAYVVYQGVVELMLAGQPLDRLGDAIARQSRFGWWTDVMILTGVFAVHVAIATWQRSAAREVALHLERSQNLELRLSLLQGQLEPHFLFNSLNSVSALVRSGDRPEALAALAELSDLLRHALRASRSSAVSMADEIAFIEHYARLQRLRHGERLAIAFDVDAADWTDLACPPLLLQPLVENAVKHGVEHSAAPGSIRIEIGVIGDAVRFRVENSIDPDVPQAPAGNGVGLSITRDRLEALFGSAAVLAIDRRAGRFIATIEIPQEFIGDKPDSTDR